MDLAKLPTSCALRIMRWIQDVLWALEKDSHRVCILGFHRILDEPDTLLPDDPDIAMFRWQMELLARFFNVIPLSEAVERIKSGTLPSRAVCITFDDGYRSVYEHALPILSRLKLPASVFITSGFVGDGVMWNDRIVAAMRSFNGETLEVNSADLGILDCSSPLSKRQSMRRITQFAKYLKPDDRERLVVQVELATDARVASDQMMSIEMIRGLVKAGIEIGAHTVNHPILSSISLDEARTEIVESKRLLEEIVGVKVKYFAYPNGRYGQDFDSLHIKLVEEAGYDAAFSVSNKGDSSFECIFRIGRYLPWERRPFWFGYRIFRFLRS